MNNKLPKDLTDDDIMEIAITLHKAPKECDVYKAVAAQMYGVCTEMVTPIMRKIAKRKVWQIIARGYGTGGK